MKFKKEMTSLAFGIAALSAASANAGIITNWTVDVSAVFVESSIVDTNGATGSNPAPGVTLSNGDTSLRWGNDIGNGQSGLDIGSNPASTLVPTGVGVVLPPVANIDVTHINFPITAPSLDKVTLASTLTLTPNPTVPNGDAPVGPNTITFLIDFFETPNGDNPCANGGANGSGVNVDGCGDIFVIDKDALNFPFLYDDDTTDVDPAQLYFISFVELTSGLTPLPEAACNATIGSPVCLGFVTPEEDETTFQFGALITTERVSIPAPGVLGLMGLGLLGLAGMRRRKA